MIALFVETDINNLGIPVLFRSTLMASAKLTFAVSKDFIFFSVTCTSREAARCTEPDVAAQRMRSK